jgi:3-methylfumaryl-CoA hydratase
MGEDFSGWLGRSVVRQDVVTARLLAEYRATMAPYLFEAPDAAECPPGFHFGVAPAIPAMQQTGEDGAEARGIFLPPTTLPCRMWAGGSIESCEPLRLGDRVTRRSEIAGVSPRSGGSGDLLVVSIRHEIGSERGVAIRERQDLVFRVAGPLPPAGAGQAQRRDADWRVAASALLLFRFSAFTFNGHRIHYDVRYAEAEGYPGLLVHGPLQAALMLNLAATKLGKVPPKLEYRCLAPLFAGTTFGVAFREGLVSVVRDDGVTTAEGRFPGPGTA